MFEQISVRQLYPDTTEISWTVLPGYDLSAIAFIVERSESPKSDFEEISRPLPSLESGLLSNTYLDTSIKNYNKHRTLYYRVRAVDMSKDTLFLSDPEHSRYPRDMIAMEIARRNNILLRRAIGIPAYVYIAKTYGQKCECWDEVKMRRKISDCDQCFGTGYMGGFCAGIPTYLSMSIDIMAKQITDFGALQPNEADAWTGHFPIVKPADVIFTEEARYRVIDVKRPHQKGSIVMQFIRLTQLARTDVEYKIERPEFDQLEYDDRVIRIFGGGHGDYISATHEKDQGEYAGWDPIQGYLKSDGIDFDTEVGR